jgi:hypothetical protein
MGITVVASTFPGGYTPICNQCGIHLCWDISEDEYQQRPVFWDNWECRDCRKPTVDYGKESQKTSAAR